ncbi:MAG TPA: hypothetical protein EYH22_00310 [Candidatus Nanopusillus sp.]|nr:hypothetical protein [Candidatus Nanopusillus sp.]
MPSETVEAAFIFFILFIISVSIINLFLALQKNSFSSLDKMLVEEIKNKIFLAYITSLSFKNSTIILDLSDFKNTWIIGNFDGLTINIEADSTEIAVNNTKGVGYGKVYFYNKNGIIYII